VVCPTEWLPLVHSNQHNKSICVYWRTSSARQLRSGNLLRVASWSVDIEEKWILSVTGGITDTCPLVFEILREAPCSATFHILLTIISSIEERSVSIDAKWNFERGSWSTGSSLRMGDVMASAAGFVKDGVLRGELMLLPDSEQHEALKAFPAASDFPLKSCGLSTKSIMSRTTVISNHPRIIVFDCLLSNTECEHLIMLAAPHMRRSLVSGRAVSENRTSWSMFCTNGLELDPVVQCVERRCIFYMKLLGVHVVPDNEKLQIIRYIAGEEFKAHFDNGRSLFSLFLCQRLLTFPCQMSEIAANVQPRCSYVESGGETYFPKGLLMHKSSGYDGISARGSGISIAPKKGRALVFFSRRHDGAEDPCSLH
ncbi:unnamed protein product, partial [Closterium sp. Naga37s-1]